MRNSGDQVRITAQLINTRTGAHEWSETYDRPIGDVLKMQDAIAAAVVRELQLTVAPGYMGARSSLKNAEAYDLVLRGRHAADQWNKEGFHEAVSLFRQAVDRDGASADAAAELAFAYYQQGAYAFIAPSIAFEQSRHAAALALKLDPKSARAHFVLGHVNLIYDWDWTAAEREFEQAATLAPGSPDPLSGQARLSLTLGRWDDAFAQMKGALARDPLDPNSLQFLSLIQARRGHLPEAEVALRKLLDIRPAYGWGHFYLALIMLARGERDTVLQVMEQESTDDARQAGLAMVYWALGKKGDSDTALAAMIKQYGDIDAYEIAIIYGFRSQKEEAMVWLNRAFIQKNPDVYTIKGDFPVTALEGDPRYKAFLKKMNLPK